jgi:NADH:ubiquinone oxidoreductase subunit 2 (subunit N)
MADFLPYLIALADWVWLVPALPFLASVFIAVRVLCGKGAGEGAEPPTVRAALAAALAGLFLLLAIDLGAVLAGAPGHRILGRWFGSGLLTVNFSFVLDGLSLPVATLVAFIGWVTLHFSVRYLHREAGFHRFFLVMGLFLAGMQLIVLSGNGLLTLVGWELAGVSSWLLIGYAWQRPTATGNALFAFITNRVGDAGLLLGLGLSAWWFGSFEWPALAGNGQLPTFTARLLAFGFVVAALAKSAQLPFTPWIPRALEGPTPSSAIFYGAVMVHAGVYLMLRLEPVLVQAPDVMAGLAVAGVATAVYAWLCGLVQTDVKTALIYAVVFQVSLMFVAIGLGWFSLAAWHLGLHAAWRAWQFLVAPSWLHIAGAPPWPAPAWLRRRQWLYTAALERFWVHRLADVLLAQTTVSLARDVRGFDEHFIDQAVGEAGKGEALHRDQPLIVGHGLSGRVLAHLAEHLQKLETHLSLRGRGGAGERLLRRGGHYLQVVETLLEQPRYLLLAVMATFLVIL